MTRVVHCRVEDYDVYVGRGPCPKTWLCGRWGNPVPLKTTKDPAEREQCLRDYLIWLTTSKQAAKLYPYLEELRGKVLACWCKPREGFQGRLLCHGQILAGCVEGIPPERIE